LPDLLIRAGGRFIAPRMTQTPIDLAHAAMEQAADSDVARLAFWGRLMGAELFVLLETEPDGADITPDLYAVDEGQFALVFDTADRLAAFAERTVPMVSMSGRALVGMLTGHDIGLALNPGVAPSEMLIPADAVDWLADTLANAPVEQAGRPRGFTAPDGMPDGLFEVLDEKLASATGMAATAWLAGAEWDDGGRGLVLAVIDAAPGAEGPLAAAVAEALAFSGLGQGWLDVMFLTGDDPVADSVRAVGLGFILPQADTMAPTPPGMDPAKPPKLR
jgi:hypothetical protein